MIDRRIDTSRFDIGLPDRRVLAAFLNLPSVRRGLEPEVGEVSDVWLVSRGPADHRLEISAEGLEELGRLGRLLRASLRSEGADARLLAGLRAFLAACPVTYGLDERGLHISPLRRADEGKLPALELALLAAETIEAGEWQKLKQCPSCGCAFYDTSRNGMRLWCSMATCGNRAKVSRWRDRHNSPAGGGREVSCGCRQECRCGAGGSDTRAEAVGGE